MPKNRKSNREAKKEPALTMKEKRSAKKAKQSESTFSVNPTTARKPVGKQSAV